MATALAAAFSVFTLAQAHCPCLRPGESSPKFPTLRPANIIASGRGGGIA